MCFDAWVRAALMGERANIECFPTQAAGACLARALRGTGIFLNSLYAAELGKCGHNSRRPLRHLIFAQGPLSGVELHPQQCGIFSGGNRTTAKNLDRTKLAQLGEAQARDGLAHLLERSLVGKHEREIPFHCRIFSQWHEPSLSASQVCITARDQTQPEKHLAAAFVRLRCQDESARTGPPARHSPAPGPSARDENIPRWLGRNSRLRQTRPKYFRRRL